MNLNEFVPVLITEALPMFIGVLEAWHLIFTLRRDGDSLRIRQVSD